MSVVLILMVLTVISGVIIDSHQRLICKHKSCQDLQSIDLYDMSRYLVDGKEISIDSRYESFAVNCSGASVLDSPALPFANPALNMKHLVLANCPLPKNRSLAATLEAFNVTLRRVGRTAPRIELSSLPTTPKLAASHLTGVEYLVSFFVSADPSELISPKSGFLAPLQTLAALRMVNVKIHVGDLDLLPVSLKELTLLKVNVEQLPEVLTSSPNLEYLHVESTLALNIPSIGPALDELWLESPATSVKLISVPLLASIELTFWTEEKPNPLASCDNLQRVEMRMPALKVLPDGWFTNCSKLFYLQLRGARNLTALPDKLLLNANMLHSLLIIDASLEMLPNGLLKEAPNLDSLDLSGNRLLTLSSKMYLPPTLTSIVLSSNDLDSAAVDSLAPLWRLVHLDLSNNFRLGDVCKETGYSPIYKATNLRYLLLSGTSLNRICIDWRLDLKRLRILDLSRTNITKLFNEDLHFDHSDAPSDAEILLKGVPVKVVEITQDYYEQLKMKKITLTNQGTVQMDAVLTCNCQMYWTRLALEMGALDHINGLYCADKQSLKVIAQDDLTCDSTTECTAFKHLPASCSCQWRPDIKAPGGVVHVNCSHTSLNYIPHLNASFQPLRHYHLLLADNNITQLQATDLHENITVLDLRNNSIQRVDNKTAEELTHSVGILRLAGNPFECDCEAAPLLSALQRRAAASIGTDIANATCHDGRSLLSITVEACINFGPNSIAAYVLAGGLFGLLLIVISVAVCLRSQSRRFFLRAVLNRWGLLWRAAEPETDDERPYDAFLTFSHEDEAVAIQLVRRLEPTYRLCLHYRDWAPGRLIAEQITESVEWSRRTVALVSRNFLSSAWARAEFRSAHSAALRDSSHRLIVVLLEEPEVLSLDDQLNRYLQTNTYLRWGDPWFWDKLEVALPPPRPPRPPTEPQDFPLHVNLSRCLTYDENL